ncbi:hypothetical protein APICC_05944 [Apis cerana cerana]|uniref:Uncharacterized protein n=1 Tax=Apis cerana cerana TaxID=94128 RepID=A0A2A3EJV8_APICC|nr:hypothetical protein APICC_05944 [Apis cerana cerana]
MEDITNYCKNTLQNVQVYTSRLHPFADYEHRFSCLQCVSSSDCCPGTWCHTYANRCQVRITEEELMKQREKILGRKGKDY